jgi:hypothetical protein
MTKALLILVAAVVVGVATNASAEDMARDQAYCRQLVDLYTSGGSGNGPWSPSLDASIALDQCRSGNPAPAIPVLQERLRDAGFEVPGRP